MQGHENGLDVWHLTFDEWEFKLAIDGSEHAWEGGRVSRLNLRYFVGRQRTVDIEFDHLPERMWFRQIDQMLTLMTDIDEVYTGRDILV